jgi:arylsulfatase
MWLYIDADFMGEIYKAKSTGQDPATLNIKPDLTKRGAIRSVTDGRYRFSRYFSPLQHNRPVTMEEIRALNDVELYDLEADPSEMKNLAVDVDANGDLMLAMNQKLANSIEYEVGSDEGEFLPDNKNGWAITNIDP